MTKPAIRAQMKARLQQMTPADRAAFSEAICRGIRAHPAWRPDATVCAFLPLRTEPDLTPLWRECAHPALCFPQVQGEGIRLVHISDSSVLERTDWRFQLPEIAALPDALLASVDLILVPGVAFTRDGARLGRGGGHYDRLLSRKSPHTATLGVCFETQLLDALPCEPHDIRIDAVVTECRTHAAAL